MPIAPNARYRVVTKPDETRIRLAFVGDKVVEAKKLEPKKKGEHSHKHAGGHKR